MAVFEVGDNELPRKKGYLNWGEKIGTPTILDSDFRSENKHRIQNLSFVVFVTVQKFLLFGLSVIENPKNKNPKSKIHLITLSTRYSTDFGIVRPICFAVLRLITSSNFIGRSTGSSVGFIPLRILST